MQNVLGHDELMKKKRKKRREEKKKRKKRRRQIRFTQMLPGNE